MNLELLPPPQKQKLQKLTSLDDLWVVFTKLRGEIMPSTRNHYAIVGRKFCNFMREKKLNPQAMLEWMMFLIESGLEPSTIEFINIKVKAFLKFLRKMNYTSEDLSAAMPKNPQVKAKEAVMFTEEEYETIKKYCTGRDWCQVHLWLIILGYRTGLSLVDAAHLRWCNVHLDENGPSYIDIHRIKTVRLGSKSLCQIPIIPFSDVHDWLIQLKKAERMYRHDGVTDYVHQDAPGFYSYTSQRIQQDFKNIFNRAGVFGKTYRNFRNSFCSNLVNSGTQIALVCKMTGHNNVEMLMRYLKPDRKALADGLAKSFQYSANQAGVGKGSDPLNGL